MFFKFVLVLFWRLFGICGCFCCFFRVGMSDGTFWTGNHPRLEMHVHLGVPDGWMVFEVCSVARFGRMLFLFGSLLQCMLCRVSFGIVLCMSLLVGH